MSVNNYMCVRYESTLRDKIRYARNLLKGRRLWRGMEPLKGLMHFAQDRYVGMYLAGHSIRAMPLSDAIPVYVEPDYPRSPDRRPRLSRENAILDDPNKGTWAKTQ